MGVSGLYKETYVFTEKGNFRIEYTLAGYPKGMENIFVTDVNTDIETSRKIETNRWKLDSGANTFTVYDDDGITPFIIFDMKNASGTPSVNRIFEREPQ